MLPQNLAKMDLDVLVVGAGPAGLAAANICSQDGVNYCVLEMGKEIEERNRDFAEDVCSGIGGAGLFSDGKLSFFPSAHRLWSLPSSPVLKNGYGWLRNLVADFFESFPEYPTSFFPEQFYCSSSTTEFNTKEYQSLVLSTDQQRLLLKRLSIPVNHNIITGFHVDSILPNAKGFTVNLTKISNRKETLQINATQLIYCAGRYGSLFLSTIANLVPQVYQRFEIGVRIEQNANSFFLNDSNMVDTKLILDSNDSSLEWRTFCCCREGAVIQGKFFDITSLSGSSNKSSNKSNVGFILRLNSGTLFHSHLDEIASVLQGKLPVFKCSFSDFMADTQGHFLGPWISSTLREGLKVLTDKYDLHDATLSGPCLEGVGYYPKLSSNLETDVPGLFVAGDSTGHFRGLLSAILSGYYAVKQANKRRHSSETILASSVQIKGSQTDRMHQIFTAQSKKFFYCRDAICEYVLKCGKLPINPFRVFDYFLSDRVSRDVIRNGNNQLIRASDELWVFGPISDGVLFEIVYAMNLGMPLKFFTMGTRASEIALVDNINDLTFEPEIHFTGIKKTTLLKQIEDAFLQSKSNSLQLTLGL